MFENLDPGVLKEICMIDQGQKLHVGTFKVGDMNGCLKEAASECRLGINSNALFEMEIQQIEKGILAAQRIITKAFEK